LFFQPKAKDQERFGTKTKSSGKEWLKQRIEEIIQNIHITVQNVHIRIESSIPRSPQPGGASPMPMPMCNAIGLVLPCLSCIPGTGSKSLLERRVVAGAEHVLHRIKGTRMKKLLSLKQLQVYCDYDVPSYCGGSKPLHEVFKHNWKTETHTGKVR
jgi:hypothetical protein